MNTIEQDLQTGSTYQQIAQKYKDFLITGGMNPN
jgi:hypothetical protein